VLNRELNLPVPPAAPAAYLAKIASKADVSGQTRRRARDLLNAVDTQQVATGRNPLGAAAPGAVSSRIDVSELKMTTGPINRLIPHLRERVYEVP